jgi:plasmid stabilization system protein ParE
MTIVWTQKALKSYFVILDYLQNEWGERVTHNFIVNIEHILLQIQKYPKMYETSVHYKNVRKATVTKHNLLFYRIAPRKKEIELLIFWDTRQDDKKKKF